MNRSAFSALVRVQFSILVLALIVAIPLPVMAQPAPQQILFTEDFENGLVPPWDWEDGWTVDQVEENRVLHGAGHIWARLMPSEELGVIESFESRVNLLSGSIHINYRTGMSGSRYFVGLERGRLTFLKMGRSQTTPTELISRSLPITFGRWYSIRIAGIENHFQVYLDEELVAEYIDQENPYPDGSIAFESLDESEVLIDDVVLKGQAPAVASSGLGWVFTGGPRGGIGYDIRFDPNDQDTIWVTDAYSGAHQSLDGGLTWIARNQGIDARTGMSGDAVPVFTLTIDPIHPEIIWAGVTGTRGLYKSTDGGQSWVRRDNGIQDQPNMEMRGITVDPSDSNVVYCGGNYLADEKTLDQRGFIYKSVDGGENWRLLIEPEALVRWIIVDPTDRNIVYASTGIFDRFAVKPTGVLKSTDAGETWAPINNGFTSLAVAALAMHPKDHLTLIAGTGKASSFTDEPNEIHGGVFITHDGGQNWRQVDPIKASGDQEIRFSVVAFAPSDPNIVYADAGHEFLRSPDGGDTWERYFVGPDLSSGMLENRGTPIALAVLPSDPNTIFMNAYDGGVFISRDGGQTWQDSSRGYSGSQIWGIAIDPHNPAFVVAASKNGVHVSFDAGGQWHGRITDGWVNNIESVAVDPQNRDNILLGQSIQAFLFQSRDGGMTWARILGPLGKDGFGTRMSIHQIAFAPSSPEIVYAATGVETLSPVGATRETQGPGIYKSTDGGTSWVAVNQGLENTTQNILAVAVHPQNPDIAYIGEMNAGVYRTLDGGKSWHPAGGGLLQTEVRALAVDPQNPETIYAGIEFGGVWKSQDGGDSWKNVSAGMPPEASVHSIIVDPTQPGILYAADMQTGVYRSTDGGATWQPFRQGLKVRAINRLAISADGQHLYAATEGNGVYRLDLNGTAPQPANSPTPEPPAASTTLPSDEVAAPSQPGETRIPPAPAAPAGQRSARIGWPVVAGGLAVLGVMVLFFSRRKK